MLAFCPIFAPQKSIFIYIYWDLINCQNPVHANLASCIHGKLPNPRPRNKNKMIKMKIKLVKLIINLKLIK